MFQKVFLSAIYLVILILYLTVPTIIPSDSHDFGSQASLEYWISKKFQFGKDIIQNVGPYGSICYPSLYVGIGDVRKFVLSNIASLGLFWLTIQALKNLSLLKNVMTLVCLLLFYQNEIRPYLSYLLGCFLFLDNPKTRNLVIIGFIFALHSLTKGACLFINLFIIIILLLFQFYIGRKNKDYKAALLVFVNIVSFVLLWRLENQKIELIPNMIVSMYQFCAGYSSMAIFESTWHFVGGLFSLLVLSGTLLKFLTCPAEINFLDRSKRFFFLICVSLITFFVWKHGFVRADGHMAIFISFIPIVIILIWFRQKNENIFKHNILIFPLIVMIGFWMILPCYESPEKKFKIINKQNPVTKFSDSILPKLNFLANFDSSFQKLDQLLLVAKNDMSLPHIKNLIGFSDISYFGIYPGKMVFSNFNHIPSPLTISFTGWNDYSIKINTEFFNNDRRPTFLIEEPDTIDNRFYPADDSITKMTILNNYKIINEYPNFNLLKKRVTNCELKFQKSYQKTFKINEKIAFDDNRDYPTFVRIYLKRTLLEKFCSFIYKPPQYILKIKDSNGCEKQYKLVVDAAEVGFLLSPIIENVYELSFVRDKNSYNKYIKKKEKLLRSCNDLSVCVEQLKFFASKSGIIEVFAVHGLRFGEENIQRQKPWIFYAWNFTIPTEIMMQKILLKNSFFYYLPPPASFDFDVRSAKEVIIQSYMPPETYLDQKRSDGVILHLQYFDKNSNFLGAQRKEFNPLKIKKDRGIVNSKFNVFKNSSRCKVTIDKKENPAWDQFYISNIFKK